MTNYIFGDWMGEIMSKISPKTQYEGTMLGMVLMLISLVISGIYYLFFTQASLTSKILIGFNGICGLLILQSFLITTFQQYRNYMEIEEFRTVVAISDVENINLVKGGLENEKEI